jgi:hypothetical protein
VRLVGLVDVLAVGARARRLLSLSPMLRTWLKFVGDHRRAVACECRQGRCRSVGEAGSTDERAAAMRSRQVEQSGHCVQRVLFALVTLVTAAPHSARSTT